MLFSFRVQMKIIFIYLYTIPLFWASKVQWCLKLFQVCAPGHININYIFASERVRACGFARWTFIAFHFGMEHNVTLSMKCHWHILWLMYYTPVPTLKIIHYLCKWAVNWKYTWNISHRPCVSRRRKNSVFDAGSFVCSFVHCHCHFGFYVKADASLVRRAASRLNVHKSWCVCIRIACMVELEPSDYNELKYPNGWIFIIIPVAILNNAFHLTQNASKSADERKWNAQRGRGRDRQKRRNIVPKMSRADSKCKKIFYCWL